MFLSLPQASAELSLSLKVLDGFRNTSKSVRNRSAPGIWLGFVQFGGRFGSQIVEFRPDTCKVSGPLELSRGESGGAGRAAELPGCYLEEWRVVSPTLCYTIVLPGRKSTFRVGCRPGSSRESLKISPPAGRRQAGGPMLKLSRLESGRIPARKPDFRPGNTIA